MRLMCKTLQWGFIFVENILTYMGVCMNSLEMTNRKI